MKLYFLCLCFLGFLFLTECSDKDPTKVTYKEEVSRTDTTVIMRVWKYERVELGFDTLRYEMRKDGNTLDEHNPPRIRVKQ